MVKKITMKEVLNKKGQRPTLHELFRRIPGVSNYSIRGISKGYLITFSYAGVQRTIECWANGCPDLKTLEPKDTTLQHDLDIVFSPYCVNL